MLIGINALYFRPGLVGGSEVYLRNLLATLARIDNENDYLLFVNPDGAGSLNDGGRFEEVVMDYTPGSTAARLWNEQVALPRLAKRNGVKVIHSPGNIMPLVPGAPSVLTVHDLQQAYYPEYFPARVRAIRRASCRASAGRNNMVIATSEATASDLSGRMGLDRKKIRVIHHGMPDGFDAPAAEQLAHVRGKYLLPDRFVYFGAHTYPHKNHAGLVRAFRRLKDEGNVDGLGLVLSGGVRSGFGVLRKEMEQCRNGNDILFLGDIPAKDVACLYRLATLFAFPSLFEGFGFPVLEAMACGCPVVASDRTSVPEVAGDAALLVDPEDEEAFAAAMSRVLCGGQLKKSMVEKGKARAAGFTWEKTARRTLDVYREAADGN